MSVALEKITVGERSRADNFIFIKINDAPNIVVNS